ncbi:Aspartic proteinase-like protein 1 [Vitis vinifera]|uniref:Aspartic proteinase-like protein 1 n=1 Tax=Vitis vinifera TaxID=29760 RepID=A0A438F7S6_VITVI|nr:Aspartic proteinase-like protein 1 [Vitis vinifera]
MCLLQLICAVVQLRLGRDLNEYSPSLSSTSKPLSCNDHYVNWVQTAKVQRTLALTLLATIQRIPQVLEQSGAFSDGAAPDGLMGLGPGTFQFLCYYLIEVEGYLVGSSSLKTAGFQALVDSGTSFTFLPYEIYEKIVVEFDKQVNATRSSFKGPPGSTVIILGGFRELLNIPTVTLVFAMNQSFIVHNPVIKLFSENEEFNVFCLPIQLYMKNLASLAQMDLYYAENFMWGYRMVFDRENLKLGWSTSNCKLHYVFLLQEKPLSLIYQIPCFQLQSL